jgi:3-deoxy-D-manno-octulosonate 8-phosphate phosphatase (KDO 8-P phosphatase)
MKSRVAGRESRVADRKSRVASRKTRVAGRKSRVVNRAKQIKLFLFDVDGVLTDGRVQIHADGTESKTFGIRDGIAMVWAQRAGIPVGFLSARLSPTTPHRAAQLGITLVYHGVQSKLATYEQILKDRNLQDGDIAYMGDDVVDLAVLARAGLSAAPADAVAEVRSRVHWVSTAQAGSGAARELIELVLKAQNRWEDVVAAYLNEAHLARTTSS